MRKQSEFNSRKSRRERLDEAAGGCEAARKAEDDSVDERVRRNIEKYGA